MKNFFRPLLLLALAGTFTLTSCTQENPEIHSEETREEVAQLAEKYYAPNLPLEESRKLEAALGKLDGKKTELMLEMMRNEDLKRFERLRRNPVRQVPQTAADGSTTLVEEPVTEAELSSLRKEIDQVYERKKQAHQVAQREHGKGWFQLQPEHRNQIAARILGIGYEPPVAAARTAKCAEAAYCPRPDCPYATNYTAQLGILVINQGVQIFIDLGNFGEGYRHGALNAIDGCDGECDFISYVGGAGGKAQVSNITASGRDLLNLFGGNGAYLGRGYVYQAGYTACGSYAEPQYALWGARRVKYHYLSTSQLGVIQDFATSKRVWPVTI